MNQGELNQVELSVVRRAYAKQVVFAAGNDDPRMEAALAELPREAFLGPGPWQIMTPHGGYRTTPTDGLVYLYQDVLVGMITEKGLNNGQPSFLTFMISLARPQEGESAVHIGAGQGYYTAIIARLVGGTGKVTAVEYEEVLAARAAANLSRFPQVQVVHGDGSTMLLEPADILYVNAGAVRPANGWLDAMKDGGRLVLPLTVSSKPSTGHSTTSGAVFLIERQGDSYLAECKSRVSIYPCTGVRDETAEAALASAFQKGGFEKVKRLYRTADIEEERCWVRGPDWALAYE